MLIAWSFVIIINNQKNINAKDVFLKYIKLKQIWFNITLVNNSRL